MSFLNHEEAKKGGLACVLTIFVGIPLSWFMHDRLIASGADIHMYTFHGCIWLHGLKLNSYKGPCLSAPTSITYIYTCHVAGYSAVTCKLL